VHILQNGLAYGTVVDSMKRTYDSWKGLCMNMEEVFRHVEADTCICRMQLFLACRYTVSKAFNFWASLQCHKKWLLALLCLAIYLCRTTWLLIDGLSWNVMLRVGVKICEENSILFKNQTKITENLHVDLPTFMTALITNIIVVAFVAKG